MNWTDTSSPTITGTSSSSITSSGSSSETGTSSFSLTKSPMFHLQNNQPNPLTNMGGILAGSIVGVFVLIICIICIYQCKKRRDANI